MPLTQIATRRRLVPHVHATRIGAGGVKREMTGCLKARRGPKKAAVGLAASILTTTSHMLADDPLLPGPWSPVYFAHRNRADLANHIRNLRCHVRSGQTHDVTRSLDSGLAPRVGDNRPPQRNAFAMRFRRPLWT